MRVLAPADARSIFRFISTIGGQTYAVNGSRLARPFLQRSSGALTLEAVKLTAAFIYGILFLFSLLISSSVWHWQMQNAYFVSHRALMADFLPPFIHPGQSGNFYIRPVRVIYAIWFIYLSLTLLMPAVGTWLLFRLRQRALENTLR